MIKYTYMMLYGYVIMNSPYITVVCFVFERSGGLHLGLEDKYFDRHFHDTVQCFLMNICVLTFKLYILSRLVSEAVMSCLLLSYCEASFHLSLFFFFFCIRAWKWGLRRVDEDRCCLNISWSVWKKLFPVYSRS